MDEAVKKDPRLVEINKGISDIHRNAETHMLISKIPSWKYTLFHFFLS